ncbi:MAG: sugar phosphate isomerase/epimerase family protein [Christensenellales bacterium]|jgi:sugar phosphate isomerase/epimerase
MIKATISGFYDEVSFDLNTQISVIKELGEAYLCPRQIGKKTITQYTLEEFKEKVYPALAENNIRFSSIGSSLGKINIDDEQAYQTQLAQLKELVGICQLMNCEYIRIFSFFGCLAEPDKYADKVIKKLQGFLDVVKGTGITLLHENEKAIFGDVPERVLKIYDALKDSGLKLIFDASNFVQCGVDPLEAYHALKDYVIYYHIKDCDTASGVEVPLGTGDGRYAEIFADLAKRGYQGFMTLEPHTMKYALLKIPVHLISLLKFSKTINKIAKAYSKIDADLGKKRFERVGRKEVFLIQYNNLMNLIEEVNK